MRCLTREWVAPHSTIHACHHQRLGRGRGRTTVEMYRVPGAPGVGIGVSEVHDGIAHTRRPRTTLASIHRNTLIARVFLDAKIVFPASVSATLSRNPRRDVRSADVIRPCLGDDQGGVVLSGLGEQFTLFCRCVSQSLTFGPSQTVGGALRESPQNESLVQIAHMDSRVRSLGHWVLHTSIDIGETKQYQQRQNPVYLHPQK